MAACLERFGRHVYDVVEKPWPWPSASEDFVLPMYRQYQANPDAFLTALADIADTYGGWTAYGAERLMIEVAGGNLEAKNDLAHSLLATRDPRHLDEAEQLSEESITRKSRAFGFDGRSTRSSRSLRTRIWMARGLIAETAGDADTATGLFAKALDEAARVRDLRKEERPGTYAISVQRCGEVLACQRNPESITVLDDALDIRESQIGEDHTIWAVQDCAKSLWWAYDRLGRDVEAEAVARRYHLKGDPEEWMPSFVPNLDTNGLLSHD